MIKTKGSGPGVLRVLSQDKDLNYEVELAVLRSGVNRNKWDFRNVDRYANTFLGTPILSTDWANAVMGVSAANRLPRNQLLAYGSYLALQQVLPKGTPSDAALTYGLGQEWMRNGFLALVGGVPLFEVEQAMLPGTVNTTGQTMFPNDTIIIAGRAGSAYAPIYTGFAEGSPLVVEMNPRETGDMSIYIDVTAVMDTKVVMGSKIAVITNVGGTTGG